MRRRVLSLPATLVAVLVAGTGVGATAGDHQPSRTMVDERIGSLLSQSQYVAGVDDATVAAVERRERAELERRVRRFRRGRPPLPLAGRTVIVTDDGIATGATAHAALRVARALGARRVVLAVPVAPPDSLERLRLDADDIVTVLRPAAMWAVGAYYRDFRPVEDGEVVRILDSAPPGNGHG